MRIKTKLLPSKLSNPHLLFKTNSNFLFTPKSNQSSQNTIYTESSFQQSICINNPQKSIIPYNSKSPLFKLKKSYITQSVCTTENTSLPSINYLDGYINTSSRNYNTNKNNKLFKIKTENSKYILSLKKNSEINSKSQHFLPHAKISTQSDLSTLKNLKNWEQENIDCKSIDLDELHTYLTEYYAKSNKLNEQKELDKFYTLFIQQETYNDFVQGIATKSTKKNKVANDYMSKNKNDQGCILGNSIFKTKKKFSNLFSDHETKHDVLYTFNIDSNVLQSANQKDIKIQEYTNVIKEKSHKENITREHIMQVYKKLFDLKFTKIEINKKIEDMYMKIDTNNKIFNESSNKIKTEISEIQNELDRQLYTKNTNKVNNINTKSLECLSLKQKALISKNKKDAKLKEIANEYKENNKKYKDELQNLLDEKQVLDKEDKFYKKIKIIFVHKQRNYYLDILKRGYDVRMHGLSWVVKNLIELETKLEYNNFPTFLDAQQCDYLVKMADMSLELAQLKIILQALQDRLIKVTDEKTNLKFNKLLLYAKNMKLKEQETMCDYYNNKDNVSNLFSEVREKHSEVFKYKTEEEKINEIGVQIKKTLLDKGLNKFSQSYDDLNSLLRIIEENEDSKNYLEMIVNIRARINFLNDEKERLREEQINIFVLSYGKDNIYQNVKKSMSYDLISSALFGNSFKIKL